LDTVPTLGTPQLTDVSFKQTSQDGDQSTKPDTARRQTTLAPPPPIAEVLRDLYEEEKKTA
ncbi:MAG TPA: hypothetical protein VKB86_07220, partial [Pyrinomonadaceae bacterium]|nr:hypothetical protein [Pyrinomonadaceae bacterium]